MLYLWRLLGRGLAALAPIVGAVAAVVALVEYDEDARLVTILAEVYPRLVMVIIVLVGFYALVKTTRFAWSLAVRPSRRFRALADELEAEARRLDKDDPLNLIDKTGTPLDRDLRVLRLATLRGDLTRLRIGGPEHNALSWPRFVRDLTLYARNDDLKGARTKYPRRGGTPS